MDDTTTALAQQAQLSTTKRDERNRQTRYRIGTRNEMGLPEGKRRELGGGTCGGTSYVVIIST